MKTGKDLEKLVEHIERAIADKKSVKVERDKKLKDRTTGRLRQHDVVLTINQGHHNVLVSIECRDRSRPVTVDQVEGFWAKCQDTGIAHGVIVSSKSFYKSARKKAEHLGIRCLDLEQAVSLKWLLGPSLRVTHRILKHTNWTVIPEHQLTVPFAEFRIINQEGQEITREILRANILQKIEAERPGYFPPSRERFIFLGKGLFLEHKETENRIPISHLVADTEFEVKTDEAIFELIKYVDKSSGQHITDAAVANVEVGKLFGKLMIVYKFDEGGKILFVPEKKEES